MKKVLLVISCGIIFNSFAQLKKPNVVHSGSITITSGTPNTSARILSLLITPFCAVLLCTGCLESNKRIEK